MIETVYADQWLYSKLTGDATLASLIGARVYSYMAPLGATLPAIIYAYQGGKDVTEVANYRIFNSGLYQVKAVGQGESMVAIAAIAHRIDTVLHRSSGTVSGGAILACVREPGRSALSYAEYTNGVRYNHLGGIYRILVQES